MTRSKLYKVLFSRLNQPRRFIQVLAGPRQVGKTTLARQGLDDLPNKDGVDISSIH